MTSTYTPDSSTSSATARRLGGNEHLAIALAVLAILACVLAVFLPALRIFPEEWTIPAGDSLNGALDYFVNDLLIGPVTLSEITRYIADIFAAPVIFVTELLTEGLYLTLPSGAELEIAPVPWFCLAIVLVLGAYILSGWGPAILAATTLVYVALCGLWISAIVTLVSVLFSVVACVALGLALGILAHRNRTAARILEPTYDFLQTVPVFSYLSIILLMFGFGPIAALIATVIFAMPPMARATELALNSVAPELGELATISGCTPRQRLWLVQLPSGSRQLLLGLNQVIMLCLAMVIIASIIGAGGLGADVLRSLRSMRMTQAVQSGLAITLIAISLDRMSQVWSSRATPVPAARRKLLLVAIGAVLAAAAAIMALAPDLGMLPSRPILDFGRSLDIALANFNEFARPVLVVVQDATIVWLLRPTRELLVGLPWVPVIVTVAALAAFLGGRTLALACVLLLACIALFGLWEKAMLSLYLVMASIGAALLVGFPIGVWAGRREQVYRVAVVVTDTIQTLPTFVYLIPVVVLFGVGDFPAFIAIVVYAVAPLVRYTAEGIRQVPPALLDAADMTGCTSWQKLVHVIMPAALPQILLGLNQTIMLGFGMLVITALVGSRGLEELTLVAVSKVEPGNGLIAGFGIAALAIIIDRLVRGASARLSPVRREERA